MTANSNKNIDIIRRFYEAAVSGDAKAVADFIDDERFELHQADSLPYGGVYKGIAGQKRVIQNLMNTWRDVDWRIESIMGDGDLVIAYMQLYGVGAKTGMSFSMPVAEVFRLREGRIVELRPIYWDTKRLRDCAGL